MKWLGGEGDGMLSHTNGHVSSPQVVRPQIPDPMRPQLARSQDDAMVGYVFQRPQSDPDFPIPPPFTKQPPRWALGDESIIDPAAAENLVYLSNHLTPHQMAAAAASHMGHPPHPALLHHRNGQIAPSAKKLWGVEEQKDDTKSILTLNEQMWRDPTWSTDHAVSQPITMVPRRSGSFPGSEPGSILSPRSSETGGLGVKMVEYVLATSPTSKDLEPRLRGLVLNPGDADKKDKDKAPSPFEGKKEADNGGGGCAPQNGIVQNGLADDDKGFNRTPGSRQPSPAEEDAAKNGVPVGMVGVVPAPKGGGPAPGGGGGGGVPGGGGGGVPPGQEAPPDLNHHALANHHHHHALANHHQLVNHHPHPHQHHQHPQQHQLAPHLDAVAAGGHPFDHVLMEASGAFDAGAVPGGYVGPAPGPGPGPAPGAVLPPQPAAVAPHQADSPGVLPPSFDVQQLFRSPQQQQQTQTQQTQATPQQMQLLQQQYLATQQQQQLGLAAPAAFTNAPYVINGQEPYVGALIAGPTVVPQYYGMPPWGVYPANIIQQGAAAAAAAAQAQAQAQAQQRRPLTPSSAVELPTSTPSLTAANVQVANVQGQYQVIPAYYDQNGSIVMGNVRGLGSAAPMRLVSPAPVLALNAAAAAAAAAAGAPDLTGRLLGSQPQQIATPPANHAASLYSGSQQASLYSSAPQTNGAPPIGGLQSGSGVGGGFASLASSLGYGSSSLGTLGSPALPSSLGSGLGLSAAGSGRRDSFDRSTSAFSPSLDYARGKWPQNYGALGEDQQSKLHSVWVVPRGTVTASPSPLGLASGSLTPPPQPQPQPALGASAGLQLGGAGGRGVGVLSAAPGAEAKFRNGGGVGVAGLASNGVFGSSSSLFTKLSGGAGARAAAAVAAVASGVAAGDKSPGRSRLLEDFRNNRIPSLQLRDLVNHIVEFSQDQHGSRFIQQKLERATVAEKQMVFSEILAAAYNLMTDVFGNYVIQKFFEFGTPEQKTTLAQKVRGHVLPLALQMYGCRVIQKALESISREQQQEIVRELDGHVLKCVKDQNGNHVVQKCIERVVPHALQFIINAFSGQVFSLSTHPYGCRVIQRILEHCTMDQTAPILEELHQHTEQLIQDQYGNYVIQHVLEHGKPEDKLQIILTVRGKVLPLSQHKFASNVVEKCVTYATRSERAALIEEVCSFNDSALQVMMKDQYANYVVQKMIDIAEPNQRKVLMHKIRPHLSTVRKYTYGKHIIAKLEKFFMKSSPSQMGVGQVVGVGPVGSELGPIGPPSNGGL